MHMDRISTKHAIDVMVNTPDSNCLAEHELIGNVRCNVVFVCQVHDHERRLNLRRDNYGTWEDGHREPKMPFQNCRKTTIANANTYVWRNCFTCKSYRKLKKTEIYRAECKKDGTVGAIISPMIIAYRFQDDPVEVVVRPHGNSNTTQPFHPATRTLLSELREHATAQLHHAPSRIYNKVPTCSKNDSQNIITNITRQGKIWVGIEFW